MPEIVLPEYRNSFCVCVSTGCSGDRYLLRKEGGPPSCFLLPPSLARNPGRTPQRAQCGVRAPSLLIRSRTRPPPVVSRTLPTPAPHLSTQLTFPDADPKVTRGIAPFFDDDGGPWTMEKLSTTGPPALGVLSLEGAGWGGRGLRDGGGGGVRLKGLEFVGQPHRITLAYQRPSKTVTLRPSAGAPMSSCPARWSFRTTTTEAAAATTATPRARAQHFPVFMMFRRGEPLLVLVVVVCFDFVVLPGFLDRSEIRVGVACVAPRPVCNRFR